MNASPTPPNLVLGIDPGLTGALALISLPTPLNPVFGLISVWDFPTHSIKGKLQLDLHQLAQSIEIHATNIRLAVVEDVHAMPGQGTVSMFNFGKTTGAVHGILASLMVPVALTRPQVWKHMMGLSRDKDLSRQRITQLYPHHSHLFQRKKDDGRAEAALIALFGAKNLC